MINAEIKRTNNNMIKAEIKRILNINQVCEYALERNPQVETIIYSVLQSYMYFV